MQFVFSAAPLIFHLHNNIIFTFLRHKVEICCMKIVNFFKQDHFPSAALSKSLNTHCSTPLSCRRHASHQKQPSVLSNQHRGSHKWTSGSLTLLPSPHEMQDLGVTSFIGCPLPIHPTISTRQLLQLSSKQLGDKLQPFSHGPYQPLQPHHLLEGKWS